MVNYACAFSQSESGIHFGWIIINNNIIGWGFCNIQNNQGQGQVLSAEPKAKADNTYQDLDYWGYCKIPKISPGLIFFKGPFWGAYFWWGVYSERLMYGGKFAFQNQLGQFFGRKCTIFALFYFVFELQFTSTNPPRGLIFGGVM